MEQNESARRLNFTGAYNLEITPAKITLVAANSGAEMAIWKYKHLRTYGKAHGKFNFECGRSSETGAGTFIFNTTCAKEIFGVVHRNIKQMRIQMEQEAQERVGMQMTQSSLPKQQSVPALSQPHKAASTKPSAKRQHQQPPKPAPYKKKKGAESMSVGTYRWGSVGREIHWLLFIVVFAVNTVISYSTLNELNYSLLEQAEQRI